MAALVLLAACSKSSSKPVALDADAVELPEPRLTVVFNGAWRLTAEFRWRTCGERACWTFDRGRHGGADVFGVFLQAGPPITVQNARLTLRSSCGTETTIGDPVTAGRGAFFIVQEKSTDKGRCRQFPSERDFNLAAGTAEVVVTPQAGTRCEGLVAASSLYGHSAGRAGGKPTIDARVPGDPRIDWGGNDGPEFTGLSQNGVYDCTGAAKNP